jgi:hypothetical protein
MLRAKGCPLPQMLMNDELLYARALANPHLVPFHHRGFAPGGG